MKYPLILISALLLAGCSVDYQTTSGAAYLAQGEIDDPDLRRAAAYEPTLHFPARIGVVKLVYGQISTTPSTERAAFAKTLEKVPGPLSHLGPLDAEMFGLNTNRWNRLDQNDIRQLAASRHLDYVLIIAYNPSQNTAEALFMDVRSGYPYASAETAAQGHGSRNFWGGPLRNQSRIDASTLRLARKLAPEIAVMIDALAARAN